MMTGRHQPHFSIALAIAVANCLLASLAAGHGGGMLVQTLDGKLVMGYDDDLNNQEIMGVRAFSGQFPSFFAWNDPGFLSLSNPPAGYGALPTGQEVFWDFLPMTVGGVTSNLLYWDGAGGTLEDVAFATSSQAGLKMTLYGRNNQAASADGTPQMIPGKVLERTLTSGSLRLHAHQFFSLEIDGGGTPAEGFYLVALQLRMNDLRATEPFYVAWGTLGASLAVLDGTVVPWIDARVDELVRPGDFTFDGRVDGGDFLVWQRQYGMSGPFPLDGAKPDGDGDGTVGTEDLVVWTEGFGAGAQPAAAPPLAAVPEPPAMELVAVALVLSAPMLLSRLFSAPGSARGSKTAQ